MARAVRRSRVRMTQRQTFRVVALVAGLVAVAWLAMWVAEDCSAEGRTVSDLVAAEEHRCLEQLLASGANPDQPVVGGLTPLMRAAARDDAVAIEVLLAAGAGVDLAGQEGMSALQVAARADAPSAVSALLEAGAESDVRSLNGMAVVHHAAAVGSSRVIRVLADAGVALDDQSDVVVQGHGHPRDVGPTALGLAAGGDHLEAVEVLLDSGADVNGLSKRSITPLLSAVFADRSPAVVRALLSAGADREVAVGCEAGCSSKEILDVCGWAIELGRVDLIRAMSCSASTGE